MARASWEQAGDEAQRVQDAHNAGIQRRLRELNDYQKQPSRRDSVVSALTSVLARGARDFPDALGNLRAFQDVVKLAERLADEIL